MDSAVNIERLDSLEPFITGALRDGLNWFTASIDTNMAWPIEPVQTGYLGRTYWLLPETKRTPPAVASLKEDDEPRAGRLRMMRFLSAMAWAHSAGISTSGVGGSGKLRIEGPPNRLGVMQSNDFRVGTLPLPSNDLERLVLALMREARSLKHPSYSFLTFYRVIEALITAQERKDWLPAQIDTLLAQNDSTVGRLWHVAGSNAGLLSQHLRETRRCAIAHGQLKKGAVVDPDDLMTRAEIQAELRLIEKLADTAIRERLTL